jgi:hypothetical protein
MYNINISQIAIESTNNQYSQISNEFIAPTVIIIFSLIFLILLVSGLFIVKGRESKKKFLVIWGLNLIIGVIILTVFLLLPASTINFIKSLFSNLNS